LCANVLILRVVLVLVHNTHHILLIVGADIVPHSFVARDPLLLIIRLAGQKVAYLMIKRWNVGTLTY
jgi:hypothetical protein